MTSKNQTNSLVVATTCALAAGAYIHVALRNSRNRRRVRSNDDSLSLPVEESRDQNIFRAVPNSTVDIAIDTSRSIFLSESSDSNDSLSPMPRDLDDVDGGDSYGSRVSPIKPKALAGVPHSNATTLMVCLVALTVVAVALHSVSNPAPTPFQSKALVISAGNSLVIVPPALQQAQKQIALINEKPSFPSSEKWHTSLKGCYGPFVSFN